MNAPVLLFVVNLPETAADPQPLAFGYTPEEAEAARAFAATYRAAWLEARTAADNVEYCRVLAERYAAWAERRPASEPEHYRERYVREAEHFAARYAAARAVACSAYRALWPPCAEAGPTCLSANCPFGEGTP